jgi:beta-xylosidase
MSSSSTDAALPRPVHDGYFADPFVWRHAGAYWAIGTGPADGERLVFPLLRSDDFVSWRPHGRALPRPDPALGDTFWAPEVAWHDGAFHLYYSAGFADARHHLRVATSVDPAGPYRDAGALTDPAVCPFAIDPHPFRDADGTWWLFHARDFLDAAGGIRAGTALVVQRLDGMTRLAGDPVVVLRARHDWQRFLADRPMYGRRFDWHTLEGPAVRRRDGRYWCFYSGGRWDGDGYGVDCAVADHVLGPYSDAGADAGPRVLRTVPGRLVGPGHNSVVVGPEGASEYLAYHAWDGAMQTRRMFLERLVWTADGPRVSRDPRRPHAAPPPSPPADCRW